MLLIVLSLKEDLEYDRDNFAEEVEKVRDAVERIHMEKNQQMEENEGMKQEIELLLNESRSFQDPVDILQQEKCKIEAEMEDLALREEDIKERKNQLDKK